jgi:hypothetical protein
MTPLIAWIGLGLFTAGVCNSFIQSQLVGHDRGFRKIVCVITILLSVLIWPIPFGIILVLGFLPLRVGWTLLPRLTE